ncbi:MAG: TRAP transporter small permease [Desulfovibrio sp.]|jgi:C4-dicarboxylate transporter DctQ subunit|nr:TRAP transporter small permease [Desulfovibrio sp.]
MKIAKILTKTIEGLITIGSLIMVGVVCMEVLLRYCFGRTLFFTEELSRYIMIWIVFLGTALAMYEEKHIRIDMFIRKFPKKYQTACEIFSNIGVIFFCAVLIVEGVRILPMQMDQVAISLDVSMFWFYLAIPVGGVLGVVFLLFRSGKTLSGLKNESSGREK